MGTAIKQLHQPYIPCLDLLNAPNHFNDGVYVNDHLLIDRAFGNRHELNRIALARAMYLLLEVDALNHKKLTPARIATSFTGHYHFSTGSYVLDLMIQANPSKVLKALEALADLPLPNECGKPKTPIQLKALRSALGILRYVINGMLVTRLPLKLMENLTCRQVGQDQRLALATGNDEDGKIVQWRLSYAGKPDLHLLSLC